MTYQGSIMMKWAILFLVVVFTPYSALANDICDCEGSKKPGGPCYAGMMVSVDRPIKVWVVPAMRARAVPVILRTRVASTALQSVMISG